VGDLRTDESITVEYSRGGVEYLKTAKAVMRPYETSEIAEVIYGWASSGQCTLRTIVRKPKLDGSLPAVLLIPGYNCGSIENYNQGSYGELIKSWLYHGFVVVTIEKSGLGDSYNCQPCMETDLVSDIQIFDAGYKYMENLPFVDSRNLFIWGHSMGGIVAPEIAKLHNPRGVIVFATVFRPWSEFLLEMHRVQFPLDGKSYQETERDVRMMQKLYYELFVMKKSPEQIHQVPEFAAMTERELDYKHGNTNMWGRHWRFWQQIDSLDMAASWSAVKCPVFSIFGGADFIACSELEHELITRTVNAAHPGNATHVTIPDIDHLLIQNVNWKSAHANFSNKAYRDSHFHRAFADTVNSWMRRMTRN
jgi:alpha-beta hydrolase superfamily lysophospholipase